MEKFLTLQDISAYRIAFELSNYVWDIVVKWDGFAKYTMGNNSLMQLIPFHQILLKNLEDILKRIKRIFTGIVKVLFWKAQTGAKKQSNGNY